MSKIHCSQEDIQFIQRKPGFCYARITEVCAPVDGGKLHGYSKSYRYEPCDGYLSPVSSNVTDKYSKAKDVK